MDVHLLSECIGLVGKFSSNLDRLAYALSLRAESAHDGDSPLQLLDVDVVDVVGNELCRKTPLQAALTPLGLGDSKAAADVCQRHLGAAADVTAQMERLGWIHAKRDATMGSFKGKWAGLMAAIMEVAEEATLRTVELGMAKLPKTAWVPS